MERLPELFNLQSRSRSRKEAASKVGLPKRQVNEKA